ncbi:hypothetical protein [Actinomadura sp. 9N407]|uniref:hypothetical protein n=1 Tax=Actinomadura sp. 9N407 TaxID=3375154 RepID=UPI00379BE5ED
MRAVTTAPRPRGSAGPARAAAAALLAGALLAGCGGGADPKGAASSTPPVPAGFTQASAGELTFAYPSGWKAGAPPDGWAYLAEAPAAGSAAARVGVIKEVPQVPEPKVVIAGASTALRLNATGYDRGPNRPMRIPGATKAIRVDYTYKTGKAGQDAARGTDIAVVYGKSAAIIRIAGLQSDLPTDLADRIAGTVAVRT